MFKYIKSVLFTLTILTVVVNMSYAKNGKVLTLEKCIEMGLKNNSQFKIAASQVDRSGANVMGSYSSILPRIQTTFSSSRQKTGDATFLGDVLVGIDTTTGESIVDQRTITQPGSERNSHFAQISYTQTLFDFGRSWNSIKQAKASFEATSNSLTSARYDVYSSVKQRYFELLKATNLEREYKLAVDRSNKQLNRTQSMFEIGSVAKIDVYRSEVTLGTDEINYITQQNIVKIARANLNLVMGRDPDTPLQIVEAVVSTNPSKYPLQEALTIAEQNNPQLKRFENDMRSAEYGMKIAKSAYWPSFGVQATYSRNNSEFNRVYGGYDKNFSISLGGQVSFNIFNGFSDTAEVGRQSANHAIAKESWIDEKRRMNFNVKQALISMEAFHRISEINARNLRAAEEEYRLAQERYRVGAGTQLEVTEAQVSLTRARVTLVRAKYDAMISQAQLETAMGIIEQDNS